jgi:crotonobetainyl-CoA:carnitine CoA-transferase CaiB-like acyl-CoA transferase
MGKKEKLGPLAGVTVLDFTWVLAGPHAAKTLADMGANVIKVERYGDGANERLQNLRVTHNDVIQSSYHLNVNRGKKSLCIDVKNPRGLEIIRELIMKTDIIFENFAPGVMKRLNLDYESIKQFKPDIIYCSISCFGHWGPLSHKPGYDIIAQAASGWVGRSAPPIMAPVSIGDTMAAMHACTAMLAALHHKVITGEGQNIDISMVDCLYSLHEHAMPWYWISEVVGEPIRMEKTGQTIVSSAPYGIYNGKNGCIAIASMSENRWHPLIECLGDSCSWMKTDPRLIDVPTRSLPENTAIVHEAIEAWVQAQDSVEEAERKLEAAGIPCSRVKELDELATTDPHITAREMNPKVYQPFLGPVRMFGSPLKFSKTPSTIRGYAPFLGQHNREILTRYLDYSPAMIDALYFEKVLYEAPEVKRLPEVLKKESP